MTADNDTVDTTPNASSPQPVTKTGSPLKQEILPSSIYNYYDPYDPPPLSPRPRPRDNRTYDQTHRWTVLAREAEADELSIVSLTSEERGYYSSLIPEITGHQPGRGGESSRTSSRLGSVISGFDENAFLETDHARSDSEAEHIDREEGVERFSEIDYNEPIQFTPPARPVSQYLPVPPTEAPPENQKYVFYPLPIPKQLMLPPRLTGPNASKEIPPSTMFKPRSPKEHATDALDSFLDTHEVALQEDPDVVLQTEFDTNTLLGTLMNNLRDQKSDMKARAKTNADYVPGGKSLLEMDREVVQKMQMGKILVSRGGRNWGSSGGAGGSSRTGGSPLRKSHNGSPPHDEDEVFESVSVADVECRDEEEDVPLAVVRDRIAIQRQDAEESLVERMKRLKQEKKRREEKESETLVQRMARLKAEHNETLAERRARLRMSKISIS